MLDEQTKSEIKRLFYADHFTVNAIAEAVGVHHSSVSRILGFSKSESKKRKSKKTLLDPFQEVIKEKLELHPKMRSTRLIQIIQDRGYKGGITTLRSYVRKHRPKQSRAFKRMSVLPGEQAQVDWGHCGTLTVGRAERKLYVFVMVLSYSRAVYAEFCLNMKTPTFLRAHERAFRYFGGIPRTILYDNLKSVVISRRGRAVRFSDDICDFSGFYCYEARPCNVYAGYEKGRVERTIRYIRDNFLGARELTDLKGANASILTWCDRIANRRSWPQERHLKVIDMWNKERSNLMTLTNRRRHPTEQQSVFAKKTPWITFDLNSYSLPVAAVNKQLILEADDDTVTIRENKDVIAQHRRSYDRGQFIELDDHRRQINEHVHASNGRSFREGLVAEFPILDEILAKLFEQDHDIPSTVKQLHRLRYECGDDIFANALQQARIEQVYTVESIRNIAAQIENAEDYRPYIPVVLPDREKVKSLVITTKPLSTYDEL